MQPNNTKSQINRNGTASRRNCVSGKTPFLSGIALGNNLKSNLNVLCTYFLLHLLFNKALFHNKKLC